MKFIVKADSLLLEYLLANISNQSKNNIKSLLAKGNIVVDGMVVTKYDYKLKNGQTVEVKNKFLSKDNNIEVLYEDKDIIIVNKPDGLLTIATDKEKNNTLYRLVMDYLKKKNTNNRIFVVHRLDRETSGIVMFAKNERIKKALQDNWDKNTRNYVAVVEGVIKEKGVIKSYLTESKALMVYSSSKGKEAITKYQRLANSDSYSLVNVQIETGRKNQIRVHFKDIGHMIIGDKKYGSNFDPLRRMGLHANMIEFIHPQTKKLIKIETNIPESFIKLVKKRKNI